METMETDAPTVLDRLVSLIDNALKERKEPLLVLDYFDSCKVLCEMGKKERYSEFFKDIYFNEQGFPITSRDIRSAWSSMEMSVIKNTAIHWVKRMIRYDEKLDKVRGYYQKTGKGREFDEFLEEFKAKMKSVERNKIYSSKVYDRESWLRELSLN